MHKHLRKLSEFCHRTARRNTILPWLAAYIVIAVGVLPQAQQRMQALSGGTPLQVLDLQFYYTPATAATALSLYSPEARTYYRLFELTIDIIHPIVYAILLSLLLAWLWPTVRHHHRYHLIILLPFAMMLSDWLENLLIALTLTQYPNTSAAAIATYFTMLKWSTAVVVIILLLIGLLRQLLQLQPRRT